MNKLPLVRMALVVLVFATSSLADERPEHFEGEPAETLDAALINFTDYNARVAEVLSRDKLNATDLAQIHELTYTLTNALKTIDREIQALTRTLDALHVASESADFDGTRLQGEAYLETARNFHP